MVMGGVIFEDIVVIVINEDGKNVFKRIKGVGEGKGFTSKSP